ncbi:CALM-like protein [Mya arenaria]|uniref:CALM-like protein n=1 Tax=Mya arenaria TaxID=6604 RepID=A0ABY7FAD2_MYAAR|nr:calmodulin-beta-like [Mya arenaria]WAR19123.1 CALM-like protein [Mya arenaria]
MSKTSLKGLTESQVEELRKSFQVFDADGDGRVSRDELRTAMRRLGQNPTEDEIDDIYEQVDADGSGTIEFEEFAEMMRHRWETVDEKEELRRSFRVFDRDGDGFISEAELRCIMTQLGEMTDAEVTDMMKQADGDGDGKINYEEFVRMMTAK